MVKTPVFENQAQWLFFEGKHYQRLRLLGSGVYGRVYLYYSAVDDAWLAIKELRNNVLKEQLEREAELNQTIHGLGVLCESETQFDHCHRIIMPYFEGESLSVALSKSKTDQESLRLMKGALDALQDFHEKTHSQYRHGDISGSNFIATKEGRVVLIDFGLSHDMGARHVHVTSYFPKQTAEDVVEEDRYLNEHGDIFAMGDFLSIREGDFKGEVTRKRVHCLIHAMRDLTPEARPRCAEVKAILQAMLDQSPNDLLAKLDRYTRLNHYLETQCLQTGLSRRASELEMPMLRLDTQQGRMRDELCDEMRKGNFLHNYEDCFFKAFILICQPRWRSNCCMFKEYCYQGHNFFEALEGPRDLVVRAQSGQFDAAGWGNTFEAAVESFAQSAGSLRMVSI